MPASVGSPELDAIADRIAAEYAAEKTAVVRFEAKIAVGLSLAAVVGGFLMPSNYWGPLIGSAGLVIGLIVAIWIYDSLRREGRWFRQEELAREGLRRWQRTPAEREISN
jgi:hypothetical protein